MFIVFDCSLLFTFGSPEFGSKLLLIIYLIIVGSFKILLFIFGSSNFIVFSKLLLLVFGSLFIFVDYLLLLIFDSSKLSLTEDFSLIIVCSFKILLFIFDSFKLSFIIVDSLFEIFIFGSSKLLFIFDSIKITGFY